MGTKSAVVFPEEFWLVTNPRPGETAPLLTFSDFFEEIWRSDLGRCVPISVLRGAAFVFDFGAIPEALLPAGASTSAILRAAQKRIEIINAFSLCLHSARVELENLGGTGFRVNPHQLIHFVDGGGGMSGATTGWPPFLTDGRFVSPVNRTDVVPAGSIRTAASTLDDLITSEQNNLVSLASLLNNAVVAHSGQDYSTSLVSAWTVCEALLQTRWVGHFERAAGEEQPIPRKRRDFLTGRDFTASVVIECLAIAGDIDASLYENLGIARKARNNWIHSIESPDANKASIAIAAAARLLSEPISSTIHVSTGIMYTRF